MKGPTPVTVDDMWRMIWEQRCYSIVMVTSLFELGKVGVCALVLSLLYCTASDWNNWFSSLNVRNIGQTKELKSTETLK